MKKIQNQDSKHSFGGGYLYNKTNIKYIISLSIVLIGILSLLSGTSYAILKGNTSDTKEQVIKTGKIELTLTESYDNINKKITVMSDEDGLLQEETYNFNIKNTGDAPAKYDLKLINEVPSTYTGKVLDTKYIKIGLEINGTEYGPMSLEKVKNIIDSDIIYKKEMINFKMRIWLDKTKEKDIENLEDYKAFLKLKIEATQRPETMETKTFNYTGDVQKYTVPKEGYYYIETVGAAGGTDESFKETLKSGYGAKTSGHIFLKAGEKLYIYVGGNGGIVGEGATSGRVGGYNGGGNGGLSTFNNKAQGGGGGATDVRLVGGSWNDTSSLISRIMVAGGGGGLDSYADPAGSSYLYGLDGTIGRYDSSYTYPSIAKGATQTSGNAFGKGGNASNARTTGGGGGGGYYGGSAGGGEFAASGSGAGGSSYISGYAGVNSVKEMATITHTNDTLHYSGKYFLGGTITPNYNSGDGYARIYYEGTDLKQYNNLDNIRYIKDCISYNTVNNQNHWLELQAIKDGKNIAKGKTVTGTVDSSTNPYTRIVDGDINYTSWGNGTTMAKNQCITVDLGSTYNLDEIAVWHYFGDKRMYNDNVTSVSSDNKNWTEIINKDAYETSNGKRINRYAKQPSEFVKANTKYDYDGEDGSAPRTFWVPKTGKYKIELWGAGANTTAFNTFLEAAGASFNDNYGKIGVGGYVSGEIELNENDLLYLYTGRGAYIEFNKRTANSGSGNGGGDGGAAGTNTTYKYSAGMTGAGGTDIRLVREKTTVMSASNSLRSRIMVAGGAGGSWLSLDAAVNSSNAGGLTSYKGYSEQGNSYGGAAANQTSGSSLGKGGNGAATGSSSGYCNGHSGGGGGYYGGYGGKATGGNCYMSGGGGGSSYISGHTGCVAVTSESSSTAKSGCTTGTTNNSCSIHYSGYTFTNTVMIDGSGYNWTNTKGSQVQIPNPKGGYYPLTFGHDGHGYIRITLLN